MAEKFIQSLEGYTVHSDDDPVERDYIGGYTLVEKEGCFGLLSQRWENGRYKVIVPFVLDSPPVEGRFGHYHFEQGGERLQLNKNVFFQRFGYSLAEEDQQTGD